MLGSSDGLLEHREAKVSRTGYIALGLRLVRFHDQDRPVDLARIGEKMVLLQLDLPLGFRREDVVKISS